MPTRLPCTVASPFDILQIDPDADRDEIVRAYKRRVKETHPDHGGSIREFQLVRAAYEEITSGRRRGREHVRAFDGDRIPWKESRVEYLDYEVLDDHGWELDDEDLFERASRAGLDPDDHGRIRVETDEPLLRSVEDRGLTWPYSCRGGACANCAVAVTAGELSMPVNHILPPKMIESGIRLSCVGVPITETLQVVYNVKHLPDLDELRLPPRPFETTSLDE